MHPYFMDSEYMEIALRKKHGGEKNPKLETPML